MDRIPNKGLERRELRVAELRVVEGSRTLTGYAAVFNQETVIAGFFREIIRPGAFARAVRESQDVVAWYQHGRGAPLPLGRTTAEPPTLRLSEDEHGLRAEMDLPETQSATELLASVKRRDIKGMSFAFEVPKREGETWDESEVKTGKLPLRELLDVDLFDVSPVVFPAYQGTSLHARTAEDVLKEHRETAPAGLESEAPQQPTPKVPTEAELELDRKARELALRET